MTPRIPVLAGIPASEHKAYGSQLPSTKLTENNKAYKSLFGVLAPVSFDIYVRYASFIHSWK